MNIIRLISHFMSPEIWLDSDFPPVNNPKIGWPEVRFVKWSILYINVDKNLLLGHFDQLL